MGDILLDLFRKEQERARIRIGIWREALGCERVWAIKRKIVR